MHEAKEDPRPPIGDGLGALDAPDVEGGLAYAILKLNRLEDIVSKLADAVRALNSASARAFVETVEKLAIIESKAMASTQKLEARITALEKLLEPE